MKDSAVMITTFLRDHCLVRCVESVRKFYPDIAVYVADCGLRSGEKDEFLKANRCEYLPLPFDAGVGAMRNALFEAIPVSIKYPILIEDDIVFTDKTVLQNLVSILKSDRKISLVSARIIEKDFFPLIADLDLHDRLLTTKVITKPEWLSTSSGLRYMFCDIAPNSYALRKSVFKKPRWDEDFKGPGEHFNFALDLKYTHALTTAYTHACAWEHRPDRTGRYLKFWSRGEFNKLLLRKWDIIEQKTELGADYDGSL